jgi:hypothetical protein
MVGAAILRCAQQFSNAPNMIGVFTTLPTVACVAGTFVRRDGQARVVQFEILLKVPWQDNCLGIESPAWLSATQF